MLFEKAIIRPPFKKPHPMPDEACFLYILDGQNQTISENSVTLASEREALLMKCGSYYTRMLPSDKTGLYEAVAIHFYPEVMKKIYKDQLPYFLKIENHAQSLNITKLQSDEMIQKYIENVLFYFKHPEIVTEELLELKLKEIMVLLGNSNRSKEVREILNSLFTPRAFSFKEVIHAHIFSNLSLEELAEITNLSVSSFKREFKKIYQDSPANYMRSKRLEKAKDLLLMSELTISEIAYDCGFNDLTGFSRSFKEKFGESPSEYKMSQNAKPLS